MNSLNKVRYPPIGGRFEPVECDIRRLVECGKNERSETETSVEHVPPRAQPPNVVSHNGVDFSDNLKC
jgi:hypothetical protein